MGQWLNRQDSRLLLQHVAALTLLSGPLHPILAHAQLLELARPTRSISLTMSASLVPLSMAQALQAVLSATAMQTTYGLPLQTAEAALATSPKLT